MRKLLFVGVMALLVLALPAGASAMTMEIGLGGGYAPSISQDNDRLGHTYGMHVVFAARIDPKIITELKGQYFSATDNVDGDKSKLYSAGLAAKYFSRALYVKNADGTSTDVFTRINPYIRVGASAVDGDVSGETINTFLQYAIGGGVRWDPTEHSKDIDFEADIRTTTSTGADGEAQTIFGVFLQMNLEVEFK